MLKTPAAVHWVSAEPLLTSLDLNWYFSSHCPHCGNKGDERIRCGCMLCQVHYGRGYDKEHDDGTENRCFHGVGLDWIVTGGESGPKARPCHLDWVRSLAQQCQQASVACWVKQMGSKAYEISDWARARGSPLFADRKGADPSEWPADLRVQCFPFMRWVDGKVSQEIARD